MKTVFEQEAARKVAFSLNYIVISVSCSGATCFVAELLLKYSCWRNKVELRRL